MSCVIVDGPIDAGELLAIQIDRELRPRGPPADRAGQGVPAADGPNGWSARQLARELAIAQPNVVRALALLDLPEAVQDQVEQGALPPATAYEVSKLDDPADQAEVAARVVAEGL